VKRSAFVAALLFSFGASAAPDTYQRYYPPTVTLPTSAPTAAGDGFEITKGLAVTVVLSADTGQTLTGAGTVALWFRDPTLAYWYPAPALLTWTLSADCTGLRRCSKTFKVIQPHGRMAAIGTGVTVSSGAVSLNAIVTLSGQSQVR
jgi:hypothetical protein